MVIVYFFHEGVGDLLPDGARDRAQPVWPYNNTNNNNDNNKNDNNDK